MCCDGSGLEGLSCGNPLINSGASAADHENCDSFPGSATSYLTDDVQSPYYLAHDVERVLHFEHVLLLRQRVFWREGAADLI